MIRSTLTAVIVALFAVEATAEVTRVDVAKRADVGASGYEKIIGTIHFAIDPKDPGNQVIVELDKAPRNASGKVEFAADLYILQPRDASRGNGVALVDVVNRGRKMTLNGFSRGGTLDPATEADLGDGFLTRQGYTLVWVGWQFDVQRGRQPDGDRRAACGRRHRHRSCRVHAERSKSGRHASPISSAIRRPMGDGERRVADGSRRSLRRAAGHSARRVPAEGQHVVSMPGGFEPGRTYRFRIARTNPAVAGVGLAAFRDTASWLKHDSYGAVASALYHTPSGRRRAAGSCARSSTTASTPTSGPAGVRRRDGAHRGRGAPEHQRARRDAEQPRHVLRDDVPVRRCGAARSGISGKTDGLLDKPARAAIAEGLLHEQRRRVLGRRPVGRARPHDARRPTRTSRCPTTCAPICSPARSIRPGSSRRARAPRSSRLTTRCSTGGRCARCSWR